MGYFNNFTNQYTTDGYVGEVNQLKKVNHSRQQTSCKSFPVKWCGNCNVAWERNEGIHLYTDFPKYGLEVKQCPRCS